MTINSTQQPPNQPPQHISAPNPQMIVRRCNCGNTWCQHCGNKALGKRFFERTQGWKWQSVRQVIPTVDPDLYETPQEALESITQGKKIAQLMRDMERTEHCQIVDWVWCLEWHRNGYPHWHLFVLMEKTGKAAMLRHNRLRKHWKQGHIHEKYIRNAKHWDRLRNYIQEKGYFSKGKKHETRLPDWAREFKRSRKIRRTGSKTSPNYEKQNIEREKQVFETERQIKDQGHTTKEKLQAIKLGQWFDEQANPSQIETKGQVLDSCGATKISICGIPKYQDLGSIPLPYKIARKLPGRYRQSVGYLLEWTKEIASYICGMMKPEQIISLYNLSPIHARLAFAPCNSEG